MTAFSPGARVKMNGADAEPGTVVGMAFPFDALAVTPVIFDKDRMFVQMMPSSLLVPYLTDDEELEELARKLGFPNRPERPGAFVDSEARERWRERDARWKESLRTFKENVRGLARNGGVS